MSSLILFGVCCRMICQGHHPCPLMGFIPHCAERKLRIEFTAMMVALWRRCQREGKSPSMPHWHRSPLALTFFPVSFNGDPLLVTFTWCQQVDDGHTAAVVPMRWESKATGRPFCQALPTVTTHHPSWWTAPPQRVSSGGAECLSVSSKPRFS